MDLFEVFRISIRRWRILIPALVVAAGIGFLASMQVAPSYIGGGVLLVTYPYAADEGAAGRLSANPYYDTRTSASLLTTIADSADVRGTIRAQGGNSDYKVQLDSGRPVIIVTVTDKSEQVALETYRLLGAELGKRLTALQVAKRIPPESRVTVDDALKPQEAAISNGSRTKVLLASLALGIVLSIGLCVYADFRLRERSARRAAQPNIEDAPELAGKADAQEPEPPGGLATVAQPVVGLVPTPGGDGPDDPSIVPQNWHAAGMSTIQGASPSSAVSTAPSAAPSMAPTGPAPASGAESGLPQQPRPRPRPTPVPTESERPVVTAVERTQPIAGRNGSGPASSSEDPIGSRG